MNYKKIVIKKNVKTKEQIKMTWEEAEKEIPVGSLCSLLLHKVFSPYTIGMENIVYKLIYTF